MQYNVLILYTMNKSTINYTGREQKKYSFNNKLLTSVEGQLSSK